MENSSQNLFQKVNSWIRESVTVKLISIGILMLILLIPTSMVTSLIDERQQRRDGVVEEVSAGWGLAQTVAGPVLSVPYYHTYYDSANKKVRGEKKFAYFLPEELSVEGKVKAEERYRNIYRVLTYNAGLRFTGSFPQPDFRPWGIDDEDVIWEEALVSIGIPDMRGIQENITVNWDGKALTAGPGTGSREVVGAGVSAAVAVDTGSAQNKTYPYSFSLNLNGSRMLNFVPLGKETKVKLSSGWSTPKFGGDFLPDRRVVNDNGFEAEWHVLHLNRNYPQQWQGKQYNVDRSAFGVELLFPVDQYQKTTRSAKYDLMFISLTFMVFFFVEILNRKRIHPIQYLLVGLALCIFYTLLLSLSEQFDFNLAYLLASLGTVVMISLYSISIFRQKRLAALLGGLLIVLYGFLFTILQMDDYSLLLGSIGLFAVLAAVMYLSRKVKWYGEGG